MAVLIPRLRGVDEWLESEFPMLRSHMIKVEETMADDEYTIRAELPGCEPEQDIKISVANGMLTIEAERSEEKKDKLRSEFHYGTLHRVATLPANAKEEEITARYDRGILEVKVPLAKQEPAGRRIEIEAG